MSIITLTPNKEVYERLRLCYGVYPIELNETLVSLDKIVEKGKEVVKKLGIKENIIITAGGPNDSEGTTRFLKVEEI